MHLNVSQLLRETSGSTRAFEVDEALPSAGDAGSLPVTGSVRLLKTDKGVWVSAELYSRVTATCSRCLTECVQAVHIEIEEEFFPLDGSNAPAAPSDRQGLAEGYGIDRDHILDLAEVTRQYFVLNEPMKLLCRVDCKGLCPECGADLNQTYCRCDRISRGSRWDALLELVPSDRRIATE